MSEFFEMGGYAFYVWSSYGLTLLILLVNVISPVLHERTLLQTLARKARRKSDDNHHLNSNS